MLIHLQEEIELSPTEERFITEYHEDGRCVLTIKDITFEDEAEYTCQAKNDLGQATTFVDIFVESKCSFYHAYSIMNFVIEVIDLTYDMTFLMKTSTFLSNIIHYIHFFYSSFDYNYHKLVTLH